MVWLPLSPGGSACISVVLLRSFWDAGNAFHSRPVFLRVWRVAWHRNPFWRLKIVGIIGSSSRSRILETNITSLSWAIYRSYYFFWGGEVDGLSTLITAPNRLSQEIIMSICPVSFPILFLFVAIVEKYCGEESWWLYTPCFSLRYIYIYIGILRPPINSYDPGDRYVFW